MTSLPDLIARLEKCSGPDRELDGDIAEHFGLPPEGMERGSDYFWGGRGEQWICPEFTSSLDASIALVERMLPHSQDWKTGYGWTVSHDGAASIYIIESVRENDEWSVLHPSGSPMLGLLLALLRALKEKEDART